MLTGKGLTYGGSRPDAGDRLWSGILRGRNLKDQRRFTERQNDRRFRLGQRGDLRHGRRPGRQVVALSDSTGWVYDKDGIDLNAVKEIKEVKRGRIREYTDYRPERRVPRRQGHLVDSLRYRPPLRDAE